MKVYVRLSAPYCAGLLSRSVGEGGACPAHCLAPHLSFRRIHSPSGCQRRVGVLYCTLYGPRQMDVAPGWMMADESKLAEVTAEFRAVVLERGHILDAIVPPLVFLIVNAILGLQGAIWGSLGFAVLLTVARLVKGDRLGYALGGVAATGVAILAALLSDRAAGYFLPSLITGSLTALACLASVMVRWPLVALTSHVVRKWPLRWYRHPQVRPAYSEVTLAWAIYFTVRLALQSFLFFQDVEATILGVVNVILGWPSTVLLLVASYLYGTWRLRNLGGPSVEEFEQGVAPPWEGQQRGF